MLDLQRLEDVDEIRDERGKYRSFPVEIIFKEDRLKGFIQRCE